MQPGQGGAAAGTLSALAEDAPLHVILPHLPDHPVKHSSTRMASLNPNPVAGSFPDDSPSQ